MNGFKFILVAQEMVVDALNEYIAKLKRSINNAAVKDARIMEVCGTHTHAVAKFGIRNLLPCGVRLLSGPGCPICVTVEGYIDAAIKLLERDEIILATFGDMIKVKGTKGSLSEQRAEGKRIEVVYSPENTLALALNNQDKEVVFAAVGFETTAPIIALMAKSIKNSTIRNLSFLTSLKRMEPVIRFILENRSSRINGMLCPGHVATITGSESFRFISDEYGVPAVVCGFDAADILEGISILLEQITSRRRLQFTNQYKRCVSKAGNTKARKIMGEVFEVTDGVWRGIGNVRDSALILNKQYEMLDATKKFNIHVDLGHSITGCECSDILIGRKTPDMCARFGISCTPQNPAGPCMVSSEGACAAYYRYGGGNIYGI